MASGVAAVFVFASTALPSVNGVHTGCAVALMTQISAVPAVQVGTLGMTTLAFNEPSAAVVTVASCFAPRLNPPVLTMCDRLIQAERPPPRP
jgi:hypothetical protein